MNIHKEYAIMMIKEINDEKLLKRAYSLIQYLWARDNSTATFPQREEQDNEKTDTQQGNENCQ